MLYILLAITFLLYILRQTIVCQPYINTLNILMFIMLVLSSIYNIRYAYATSIKFNNKIYLILLSGLFFGLLFYPFSQTISIFIKFFYAISFMSYINLKSHRPNTKKLFVFFADIIVMYVLIIILLAQTNILSDNFSQNINWIKYYGGFLNPNIGPFFLFSSLFVYFLFTQNQRFYILFVIILLLWSIHVYSRTYLLGAFFLVLGHFLLSFQYSRILFFLKPSFIFFSSIGCILILGSLLHPFEYSFYTSYTSIEYSIFEYNYPKLVYLDNLLSNRLYMLYLGILQTSTMTISHIAFSIKDSLYYTLIFVYGPVIFIFYIKNMLKVFSEEFQNSQRIYFSITLISFLGLYEGILNTISPVLLLLVYLTFKHYIIQKDQYS